MLGWLLTAMLASVLILSPLSLAQEPSAKKAATSTKKPDKFESLNTILDSIERVRKELKETQAELSKPSSHGREDEVKEQISEFSNELNNLKKNFALIAAGKDPQQFSVDASSEDIDWSTELKDLLSPLLNEMKRITSRPRQIAHYRSQIQDYEDDLKQIDEAIKAIEALATAKPNPRLKAALTETEESWAELRRERSTLLQIAQQKLDQRLGERKSLTESVGNISDLFFRSRGRNLLLAIVATLLFWITLRRLHTWLGSLKRFRAKKAQRSFHYRLMNVFYLFLTGVGSVGVFLGTLFLMEDWVLLLLGLLFLLGLVWTSKEALPRFWRQAALLLNFGPVREGERVFYNGLPFEVRGLNFYTHLINPALEGGRLRLPIQDLASLRSRMSREAEPWFPTKRGDWIVLGDGTFGQVALQSLELVSVELKGKSTRHYPTTEFLSLMPQVLSNGFRISVSFGLDYQHQAIITTEIPERLKAVITRELHARGFQDAIAKIIIEFEEAAASSLNVAVIVDYEGEAATGYLELKRLMNRICVDACNEHGWTIPFTQLTVHMAEQSVA